MASMLGRIAEALPWVYRPFLRYRPRLRDETWLRTQIAMRAHSLDKTIDEPSKHRYFTFELYHLLRECARRGLAADDTTLWVWKLIYTSQFPGPHREGMRITEPVSASSRGAVEDAIRRRRSVRQWDLSRDLPEDTVRAIIDAAKWAPSSCNRQAWRFLVLSSRDDIRFFQGFVPQTSYLTAPFLLVVYMDRTHYQSEEQHYMYLDAGAVVQNILLFSHVLGLGACWYGVKWNRGIDKLTKESHARFGLGKSLVPVSMVAIGYPAQVPTAPPRRSTEELLKKGG